MTGHSRTRRLRDRGAKSGNNLGVELARVELDHELLRAGLELVDTPGSARSTVTTRPSRAISSPGRRGDVRARCGTAAVAGRARVVPRGVGRVPRLLIVVNKIDHLDAAGPGRRGAVRRLRAARPDWRCRQPSCSRSALAGGRGSRAWRAGCGGSRSDERETLHRRSVARLARSAATDTAQAARFESRATQLPLEQLDSRAAMFEQRIADLSAAAVEARDLLDRGIERARADRRRGEQHTRVRLGSWLEIERRCVELATELGAVAAPTTPGGTES